MSSATEPTPPAPVSDSETALAEPATTAPGQAPDARDEASRARPETTGTELWRRFLGVARLYWAESLFWVLGALLVAWVVWDSVSVRLATFQGGADYWEHAAALHELIQRPFSPRNPQVSSDAPSPRFVPHFLLIALLTRAGGGDSLDAMALAGVVNTALFVLGIYLFFRTYFRDRRAPLYALVVMLGSWWNAWNFSNVYQLKVFFGVAPYPSTATLGLALIGFWLTLRTLRGVRLERWAIAALSVCWAYIFITHPLTAVLALSGCGLLALTEPRVALARRGWVIGSVMFGCVLGVLWPYFPTLEVLSGGKGEESGWLSRSVSGEPKGGGYRLHYFYRRERLAETLGFALLGIPLALVTLFTRYRFIGLGALSMGAPFVINAYVPLPLGHRFVLLAVFYLQLALVWLLLLVSPKPGRALVTIRQHVLAWSGAAFALAALCVMGWMTVQSAWSVFDSARRQAAVAESPFVRYARTAAGIAGPEAIVLGDAHLTWPVPAFGTRVVTLKHENPLVEARVARAEAVDLFLARRTRDTERLRILRHFEVTHVMVRDKQEKQISRFLAEHGVRHQLPADNVLWALKQPARRN